MNETYLAGRAEVAYRRTAIRQQFTEARLRRDLRRRRRGPIALESTDGLR